MCPHIIAIFIQFPLISFPWASFLYKHKKKVCLLVVSLFGCCDLCCSFFFFFCYRYLANLCLHFLCVDYLSNIVGILWCEHVCSVSQPFLVSEQVCLLCILCVLLDCKLVWSVILRDVAAWCGLTANTFRQVTNSSCCNALLALTCYFI